MSLLALASGAYAGTSVACGAITAVRQMFRPRTESRLSHYVTGPSAAFVRVMVAPGVEAANRLNVPIRAIGALAHATAAGLAVGISAGVATAHAALKGSTIVPIPAATDDPFEPADPLIDEDDLVESNEPTDGDGQPAMTDEEFDALSDDEKQELAAKLGIVPPLE